uniref:calcium/calmodulin-dependent protein kinase type II delta chain-like n=1 Tax=Doryrhamphus excisus TaxID=161450 RepID=UPI0025AE8D83|nr:calcium/calmodulin-dependent protein kinase type II delta chain-like [Doryrhamphus excisus]
MTMKEDMMAKLFIPLLWFLLSVEGLNDRLSVQLAGKPLGGREQEVIDATNQLMLAICNADYELYQNVTDPSITSFEPEAVGQLVEGMSFHRFLFENDLPRLGGLVHIHLLNTHVRMLGEDAACMSYVRLMQYLDPDIMQSRTLKSEETRIWQHRNGKWVNVHFHRSGSPLVPSKGRL